MQYPCKAGDYIHLRNKNGMYKVKFVCEQGFFVENHKAHNQIIPWYNFKCKKGDGKVFDTELIKRHLELINNLLTR